jgi:hypothetical protein
MRISGTLSVKISSSQKEPRRKKEAIRRSCDRPYDVAGNDRRSHLRRASQEFLRRVLAQPPQKPIVGRSNL